jgi:hypothetical protein
MGCQRYGLGLPIPLPWAGLTLPVTCPDSSDDRSGISESPSIAEAPPSAGTRTVTRSVDQHRVHRRESQHRQRHPRIGQTRDHGRLPRGTGVAVLADRSAEWSRQRPDARTPCAVTFHSSRAGRGRNGPLPIPNRAPKPQLQARRMSVVQGRCFLCSRCAGAPFGRLVGL